MITFERTVSYSLTCASYTISPAGKSAKEADMPVTPAQAAGPADMDGAGAAGGNMPEVDEATEETTQVPQSGNRKKRQLGMSTRHKPRK